jgi:hypothetical protein
MGIGTCEVVPYCGRRFDAFLGLEMMILTSIFISEMLVIADGQSFMLTVYS